MKSNIPEIFPINKGDPPGALSHKWLSSPWILFVLGTGLLTGLALAKYNSLHSTYFDLGVFLNNFRNIAEGDFWLIFVGHSQPLMLAVALINKILPTDWIPAFLLFFQSAALIIPVVGIHRHYGVIPALAFVLYFPLWYNALFDFHMDHLAVPLLFGFFFLERSGRIWTAVFLALFLALTKEPFALQTAACGLYLVLIRKHYFAGIMLVTFGLGYFFFATAYLMPYFTPGAKPGLGSSAFSWLGNSLGEMVWFILSHPLITLKEILFDPNKLKYLFYIFAALAFIPLFRPGILIVALPVMAISLLSRVGNYSGLFHHYTAGLIAPLIMAFSEGLPTARKICSRLNFPKALFGPLLLVCLLIIHIKMAASPISHVFWDKDSWAYSYQAYIPAHRDKMMKEAIRLHVPSDLNVAVSAQNTLNWGYLAQRKYYLVFPFGVLQPHSVLKGSDRSLVGLSKFINTGEMTTAKTEEIWVDYVVLDLKRPWFIGDEGCPWKNGQCKNNGDFSSRFLALVQQTKERFDPIFENDGFYILKRKIFPKEISKKF